MKRLTYLSLIFCSILFVAACAEQPEFRSDTLENTSQVSSKLKDRGMSACEVIQNMADDKRKELHFPTIEVSGDRESFLALSKKLAKEFVGTDTETIQTDTKKHTYENGVKILKANEETFEIEFVNQTKPSNGDKLESPEVIRKTKEFINKYNELGKLEHYYVNHFMGGIYTASAGVDNTGKYVSTPLHQESAEITVHKVISQLPVLGGIGSIKLGIRSDDRSVSMFKIKFLTFPSELPAPSNNKVISYSEAEQKARELLTKEGKAGESFNFSCEFGYIPNSIKQTPTMLVPGYILRGASNSNEKRVTVVVPASGEFNTMYEEKYDTLSNR